MKNLIQTILTAAVAACICSTALAQEETCSTGMTELANTPQGFDSIFINPTCSSADILTTSQLAWTIEPTKDTVSRIFSYPPEAVKAVLDDNVLVFDLNDLGQVPDKAGVVIQVPESQLIDITVDGIMNYVRVARGFTNLMSLNSLGMSSILQADLSDSVDSSLIVDTSNSMHEITAENLKLKMFSVSSKLHITGNVMGGELSGYKNELMVNGQVRDLSVTGNKNDMASYDCSTVAVDSSSSSCTVMDETPFVFPISIPCTFPGCKKSCMSTSSFGTCSCTEEECDGANSPMDEMNANRSDGFFVDMSSCSCVGTSIIGVAAAMFAVVAALL